MGHEMSFMWIVHSIHRTSSMHEMAGAAMGPPAGRPAGGVKEILLNLTHPQIDASNESWNEPSI